MRNFLALGIFYAIVGIVLFKVRTTEAYVLFGFAVLLFVISYLFKKKNVTGIYIGWIFVLFGILSSIVSKNILSLIVVAYLAYWNHKASEVLKK